MGGTVIELESERVIKQSKAQMIIELGQEDGIDEDVIIERLQRKLIYAGRHRIPAILSWPGHYDNGRSCGELTCLSDLYATFAELLGVKLSDDTAEDSWGQLNRVKEMMEKMGQIYQGNV